MKSIYTTALEYGQSRFFKGVYYSEVREYVELKHKNKFDFYSESAFIKWFIKAFICENISGQNQQNLLQHYRNVLQNNYLKTNNDITHSGKFFNKFNEEYKFFITGESDRKLLEFRELQEARTNARQAFVMAVLAILISVIGIVLSPVIEHYFNVWMKPLLES